MDLTGALFAAALPAELAGFNPARVYFVEMAFAIRTICFFLSTAVVAARARARLLLRSHFVRRRLSAEKITDAASANCSTHASRTSSLSASR